ncbi:hypothetical protein NQ314_014133 [Rhamnusium bicolor]|uniref:Uncharacterized protein n=1 Tax=Rhamnusium bicolor TaxID=1586634 RepID=A0AAV8X5M4_9CUCU|nr:hypothetical protein NQ314_014133 [Rhamnusium bicolor]
MKVEDNIENISEITNVILQNLTGLYADQTENWKVVQIYQHMGYTLLCLFELLLYCNKEKLNLKKIY